MEVVYEFKTEQGKAVANAFLRLVSQIEQAEIEHDAERTRLLDQYEHSVDERVGLMGRIKELEQLVKDMRRDLAAAYDIAGIETKLPTPFDKRIKKLGIEV